jgi:hypothetical protein
MNMGVAAACGNRKAAIFTRQAVKGAAIEPGEGIRHFPYQLGVFRYGISIARPSAEPAQNKFPVFSIMPSLYPVYDI